MRSRKQIKVEAIIAKYENLASNTEAVKATLAKWDSPLNIPSDCDRLDYIEQLIYKICSIKAKECDIDNLAGNYSTFGQYYIEGLLSEDEVQFLVDNFDLFTDFAFNHLHTVATLYVNGYKSSRQWSQIICYLLEHKSGKMFIANSDRGQEFIGLDKSEIWVNFGFEDAAIRAIACNQNIHHYTEADGQNVLWSNLPDESFDIVIAQEPESSKRTIYDVFSAAYRITKKGGEILLCISKDAMLGNETTEIRSKLAEDHTLCACIELPSDDILLHIVKRYHERFVMYDASRLSKRSEERVIDEEAFVKEAKMASLPERQDNPILVSFPYNMLKKEIFIPKYYVNLPEEGKLIPLGNLVQTKSNPVSSEECLSHEKVITNNNLSRTFSLSEIETESLKDIDCSRFRHYHRISGPSVIIAVSKQEIAIGYTTEQSTYLVPKNLYVISPKNNIDIRYIVCLLLNKKVKEQIIAMVFGKDVATKLISEWTYQVIIQDRSDKDRQDLIQTTLANECTIQNKLNRNLSENFKHSVRLRKHALSQNISAFASMFTALESCMKNHNGILKATEQVSPISALTVTDAMEYLRTNIKTICHLVDHLYDENVWGKQEAIEPQQFIEDYEKTHISPIFEFRHAWEYYEPNIFDEDIINEQSGKLVFRKGDSLAAAWFPKKALVQILDNIVANAICHGFKDSSSHKYEIESSWYTEGFNLVLKIANNGIPISEDLDTNLLLEYGYSSSLNQDGHGGIGCGQIAEIMHKFGGDVQVISTPESHFTVTYVLTMPLASLY